MNFLSDNLVYRRGQDYLRRRKERQDPRSRSRSSDGPLQDETAGTPSNVDGNTTLHASTSSRLHPPPTYHHTRRAESLPFSSDPGDSADDEGEFSTVDHLVADEGVDVSSLDRAINARLGRQEQLTREKIVVEDALKSSLSTLMMLQSAAPTLTPARQSHGGSETAKSSPSLSTSPSSTLTLRGNRQDATRSSPPRATGFRVESPVFRAQSPTPRSGHYLVERRRNHPAAAGPTSTLSQFRSSDAASRGNRMNAQHANESGWSDTANLSSASSFEDLGKQSNTQEGSDLDMEFLASSEEASSISPRQVDRHSARTQLNDGIAPLSPRRRRRNRLERTYTARSTASKSRKPDGVQSDPERLDSSHRQVDDSFLDLLEATRTFMAMNPRYSSTPDGSISVRNAATSQALLEYSTPRSQSTDLPEETADRDRSATKRDREKSPPLPASMSASTNFDLSSSDSPPSHGMTSSRGGEDDPRDEYEVDAYRYVATPQPIARDPRLSSDASRESVSEGNKDESEKQDGGPKHHSWMDWLTQRVRGATVGIGIVGLGFIIAVGVGLFRSGTRRSSS